MSNFIKLLVVLVVVVAGGYAYVLGEQKEHLLKPEHGHDVIPGAHFQNATRKRHRPVLRVVTMKGYPDDKAQENEIGEDGEILGGSSTNSNCKNVRYTGTAVGQRARIYSPNFPFNYPYDEECSYFISAPENTQISITCRINIRCNPEDSIFWSLSGDETFQDSVGYCGRGRISTQKDHLTEEEDHIRWACRVEIVESENPVTPDPTPTTTEFPTEPPSITTTPPPGEKCACGQRNENGIGKVVGGTVTQRGEIPWRVNIFIFNEGSGSGFLCGGTIISPNYILTAAHCTMNFDVRTQNITIYAGAQENPVTVGDSNAKAYPYLRYVQHPQFNRQNLAHDIALIQTRTSIEYSEAVGPACLPTGTLSTNSFSGTTILASGWGTTNPVPVNEQNNDPPADTLMEVDLPILTYNECNASPYSMGVTSNQICTYEDGKDTCQGDSGGSIDYQYTNGLYYSIGVVSYGYGCAQTNYPGVYTFVTKYLDWITNNTPGETYCQPHQ